MEDAVTSERQYRQQVSRYKSAIASPPLTTLTIPATARFAIASRAGNAALASALTVTGPTARTVGVPIMVTAQRRQIGLLHRGAVVNINAALDLYVDTGIGQWKRVLRGA
jgi:hypothetical protein